jgi:hypothetical protein
MTGNQADWDVRLAHDEMDGVAGVSSSRDPPLVAIDDNLVSLDANRRLDVGRAGSRSTVVSTLYSRQDMERLTRRRRLHARS